MALINNPNSFNAGTAVFNPAPITETYLKLAAHREAKNQALEQYQRKKMESIDRDGVRDVDIPEFTKKIDDWNKHWQYSKDKIKKGDIRAQVDNDKLYNDLRAFAKNSRTRAELEKSAIPVGVSMKNEMGTYPDQFQQDLVANNLPIGAEGSNPINLMPYMMKPERWDIEKGLKKYSQLERDKKTIYGDTDTKTGLRPVRTQEFFNDKSKAQIAAIAGSDFHNDRSFNQEVRSAVADPATKQQLVEVFKENFGVAPEQPEHYATAFILSQKPLVKTEDKFEEDKQWAADQKFKRDKELEAIKQKGRVVLEGYKQGNRLSLAKAKDAMKKMNKEEQDNALDLIFQDMETESNKPGNTWNITRDGKKIGDYKVAPISPTIKNQFTIETEDSEGNKKKAQPTHIGFNKDGTVKVIYTTGEKDGSHGIDKKLTHTISKNEFKAMVGKGLGLGVTTTAGARYSGGDEDEDEVEDEEEIEVLPSSTPKSNKKKIPGF